jgi:ribosomal protein L3
MFRVLVRNVGNFQSGMVESRRNGRPRLSTRSLGSCGANTPARVLRHLLITGNTGEHERATEHFSVISETSVVCGVIPSLVP